VLRGGSFSSPRQPAHSDPKQSPHSDPKQLRESAPDADEETEIIGRACASWPGCVEENDGIQATEDDGARCPRTG
jgi:hypothetical protein